MSVPRTDLTKALKLHPQSARLPQFHYHLEHLQRLRTGRQRLLHHSEHVLGFYRRLRTGDGTALQLDAFTSLLPTLSLQPTTVDRPLAQRSDHAITKRSFVGLDGIPNGPIQLLPHSHTAFTFVLKIVSEQFVEKGFALPCQEWNFMSVKTPSVSKWNMIWRSNRP